jgi:hypothetical protein
VNLLLFLIIGFAMTDTSQILPESIGKWQRTGQEQRFSQTDLYAYINGGAELYLSYGFQNLVNQVYTCSGQPDIIIDIFDMGSAANAFGVFTHSREEIETAFGQGSQYTEGLLLFWKDRYYVSILASPETPQVKESMLSAAKYIDKAITAIGELPQLISVLPDENLIKESVRFFRHHFWLNAHYFIAEENILLIDQNSQVILAKYRSADKKPVVVLVQYESKSKADRAKRHFLEHYLPESEQEQIVQIEDGTWNGLRQNQTILAIVFQAAEAKVVKNLLDSINWR